MHAPAHPPTPAAPAPSPAPQTDPSAARPPTGPLGFVSGLIQQGKMAAFERLLFRATRGNMFLKSAPVGSVRDPASGELQDKSVFMVFFSGERARTKVMKVGSQDTTPAHTLTLCDTHPPTHTHTPTHTLPLPRHALQRV